MSIKDLFEKYLSQNSAKSIFAFENCYDDESHYDSDYDCHVDGYDDDYSEHCDDDSYWPDDD